MKMNLFQKNIKPRILIGTPVHEVKNYCFKEFLTSVKNLMDFSDSKWQFDLLLVDNSPNLQYQEKVKKLCDEIKIVNYKIIHLDLAIYDNGNFKHDRANVEERVAYCREEMNKEFSKGDYTHLFFWESDIILPPDVFLKLMKFDAQFDVISHVYPDRDDPTEERFGFGCTIIKRKWFEDFSFLYETEHYHGGEHRFLKKIRLAGGTWVELHNFFDIKHLADK